MAAVTVKDVVVRFDAATILDRVSVSVASGRKVSRPTWRVTRAGSSRASSSGVKWRPAVGAAAEPDSSAYTVW